MLIIYIYCCAIISFPNNIVIFEGEEPKIKTIHGINIGFKENKKATQASSMFGQSIYASTGTKRASLNLFNKIPVKNISIDVIEKTTVIPLGNVIGMKLYTKGVLVVGMSQINDENGKKTKPYENTGIEEGDCIVSINGENIENTNELMEKLNECNGEKINIGYLKNDEINYANITPVKSENMYKIGLWVRDTQAGVGTATFYEPSTNKFMTLGHGITDIDTGNVVNISNGELTTANVISIVKGSKGKPGEILGTIESGDTIGKVEKNTTFGVYGTVTNKSTIIGYFNNEMEVANRDEIKEGSATILCQLDNNEVKEYTIKIEKIYINNNENNKSMLIKVTDNELIEKTGGIIQGMSGSPIIQNGKFIGAITSVLVNDPAEGYGVFGDILIKKMREAN